MDDLVKKIGKRLNMIMETYKNDCAFSWKFANYRLIDELCWRFHIKGLSSVYQKKKDDWILNYLHEKLRDVIEKYRDDNDIGEREDNAPIWICWWSGADDAPLLVKQCIKSIYANAGSHKVRLITERTYKNYLEIPEYILNKVKSDTMCIANFSDYLRVSLLEKYGGLWLDATVFCSEAIPEWYFSGPLFTCKSLSRKSRYISNYRWTSFCLGGWKHHVFYRFFKEALEEYWRQEKCSIDYLLVDYIIETAYSNLPVVRKCIDDIPVNNLQRDDLQLAMNMILPSEEWDAIINRETVLYKLSWREKYELSTDDGKPSIYDYFLKLEI